jgi:yeast amino acid transporter
MAGEAQNPRLAMAHATKLVPVRVTVIYMTTVVLISFLVPIENDSLFGGSGTAASPYVIGMTLAGVKGIPDFLNVIIIIGISAVAAESIYIASRIMRTMSAQGFLPKIVRHVDHRGRPTTSLVITIVIAYAMAYINLSSKSGNSLQKTMLMDSRHRNRDLWLARRDHFILLLYGVAYSGNLLVPLPSSIEGTK